MLSILLKPLMDWLPKTVDKCKYPQFTFILFISSGIKLFGNTIITTGLDRMILFFSILYPDITEDFDSELKVDLQYQFNRKVPEDKSFLAPSNYIQPFKTYAKLTSCLDYDGKFLISAEKQLLYVWTSNTSKYLGIFKQL